MKHSNVIEFLSGSLWLATDSHMEAVSNVVDSILSGKNSELRESFLQAQSGDEEKRSFGMGGITIENGIATVPISGSIVPKANAMQAFSGGTSAELLTANINALTMRDDIHTILLDVDSNGGSVHGIQAAADAVRKARETKRVWAIAQYNMNSAAYWIGSAAEKVFTTPTSNVGSIGVISVMQFAKKEDQERMEIIRSVPGKAAITPFEPLSDEARSKLQADINRLHVSFTEAVSLNRNISMNEAEKLANGEVHLGEDAVTAGLVDEVVSSRADVLAQIEAVENLDERFQSMKSAYLADEAKIADLSAEIESLDLELQAALKQISEMTADVESREAEAMAANFESAVDAAIDSGRIAAGLKAEWMQDLKDGSVSLEAFERMVGNISAGTVVPQEDLELATEQKAEDSLAPATDEERRMFALFPSLAPKVG